MTEKQTDKDIPPPTYVPISVENYFHSQNFMIPRPNNKCIHVVNTEGGLKLYRLDDPPILLADISDEPIVTPSVKLQNYFGNLKNISIRSTRNIWHMFNTRPYFFSLLAFSITQVGISLVKRTMDTKQASGFDRDWLMPTVVLSIVAIGHEGYNKIFDKPITPVIGFSAIGILFAILKNTE